ncbi:serine/threonine protein kinase [Nannizzia gypsea CBS 118893]|uniref:Serine/threonine protein kinase n=1 Tax=Arthroderma gypseum (strain ATCC MYA-4604 / CBS 118893) TaxID=535722 RepID=E4UUS2_ARTGP|nr:serine/threonine protein kinase [Nannizzia gypsea CBS 118893]EFR01039.1 serine/threonine protein kinase [Nannizzia gypsea CBS 118893]
MRFLMNLRRSSILIRRRLSFCWVQRSKAQFSSTAELTSVHDVNHSFYNYTSGRWLYNEGKRFHERHLFFDVDKLLDIIAKSVNQSSQNVVRLAKIAEGGSYRVFEATFKNGQEVIARLPYPSTLPHTYGVASEVATIEYLRLQGIPIPKVLAWNSSSNPLGAEYVVMEKAKGGELETAWYSIGFDERKTVVKKLVAIESHLFKIKLPAFGSLYHTDSLPHGTDMVVLPDNNAFCVGPSVELLWWYHKREELKTNRGPWKSPAELLKSIGLREIQWLRLFGEPRYPREALYRELYDNKKVNPEVQIRNLEDFLSVAPYIIPSQEFLNEPTIRHPDLSPNNIFMTETGEISSIIDWERTSILPLFIQAKIPKHFQNYGDEDSENFNYPELRKDFDSLADDEKELEQEIYRKRQTHYYYLGFTSRYNENHFRAMASYSGVMRSRPYDVANRPWEGDSTTLKATLINMASYWPGIASADMKDTQYPLQYSPEEAKKCLDIDAEQKTANSQMQNIRDAVGINVDGWVPNEMYEEATERMANIKAHMLEISETEEDREDLLQNWPFQDHEEID